MAGDTINHMAGLNLRVFMNYELPFVIQKKDCPKVRWPEEMPKRCLEGLAVDFLVHLAAHLNFTYQIFFPKGRPVGRHQQDTGEWNGCIRHLMDDEGDLIVASMSINRIRSNVVTFSHPYHFTGRGFMLKNTETPVDYFRFIKPFTPEVWYAFLITLFVVATLVNIINKISPFDFHGHFVYHTSVDSKTSVVSFFIQALHKSNEF